MTDQKLPCGHLVYSIMISLLLSVIVMAPIAQALLSLGNPSSITASSHTPPRQYALCFSSTLHHRKPCFRARRTYHANLNEISGRDQSLACPVEGPSTRAEALTGILTALVSSSVVFADISRARADNLGVMDDLLADCPPVSLLHEIHGMGKAFIAYASLRDFSDCNH